MVFTSKTFITRTKTTEEPSISQSMYDIMRAKTGPIQRQNRAILTGCTVGAPRQSSSYPSTRLRWSGTSSSLLTVTTAVKEEVSATSRRVSGLLGQLIQVNILTLLLLSASSIVILPLACQLSSDWSSEGEMEENMKLELAFNHQKNTLITLTWAQLRTLDIHSEDILHVSCHGGRLSRCQAPPCWQ